MPANSVDLVITSPPFALLRQKSYGNKSQDDYVEWLAEFAHEVKRVLRSTGSFVLDLGGSYQKGRQRQKFVAPSIFERESVFFSLIWTFDGSVKKESQ